LQQIFKDHFGTYFGFSAEKIWKNVFSDYFGFSAEKIWKNVFSEIFRKCLKPKTENFPMKTLQKIIYHTFPLKVNIITLIKYTSSTTKT
jgi:hypothetical protein